MKVLFVASEVAPVIKLGGLGDVIGSLPKALEKIGIDVDVIVPFYPNAKLSGFDIYKSLEFNVGFSGALYKIEAFKTKLPNSYVDLVLLRCPEFFDIGGSSAFLNNVQETKMFTFFDRAVVSYITTGFNSYDVVHCNDWHTGLITHLLEEEIGEERPATIMTIHNISYQGVGETTLLKDLGLAPGEHRTIDWDIQDNNLNLLLQGIVSSDFVSTVSPSYAKEIMYSDIGGPLSDIVSSRKDRLVGILNGIDYSQFPRNYDVDNWKAKKLMLKRELQKKLNLKNEDKPLFAFISRLDANQKGIDILYDSVAEIIKKDGQFVLLGTGDKEWESKLLALNSTYLGNVSININFDTKLAEEIYSGSDFFLVPSRFEPCGLTQMIAMWYGSVPIVHATGGLRDSVIEGKNGFLFNIYSSEDLLKAIDRALRLYKSTQFDIIVHNALGADFGWDNSALEYKRLYERAISARI